jgi:hypothetical protein
MKTKKNLLIAAAITGALAATPIIAWAESSAPAPKPTADKLGCSGKDGCGGMDKAKDKASCQGKEHQGEARKGQDKEKSACAGKDGCGGKEKKS